METTNINFKIDAETKKDFEKICSELGLTMSAAFNVFVKKVIRERAIPFDLSLGPEEDPFHSPENIAYLEELYRQYKNGTANIVQHELIEP